MTQAAKIIGWHPSLIRDRCNGSTQIRVLDLLEIARAIQEIDSVALFAQITDSENSITVWSPEEIRFFKMLVENRIQETQFISSSSSSANGFLFQKRLLQKLTKAEANFVTNRKKLVSNN